VSYTRDGGAAEYAVATEFEMAPKPDNVTVSEAAAIALPALTAWQALFRYAGLDPDVPGGLYDVPEFGPGGNGTGRWQWQRKRRDTVLGSGDYGYGHRKSVNLNGSRNRNSSGRSSGRSPGDAGGLEQGMNDDASGSTGSGTWVWHWNRRDTILNDMSSGAGSGIENIDNLPGASAASTVDPDPNPYPTAALNATKTNSNVRRESLISLVSGTPKAAGKAPRAASTIDPNPKNTVRRASLVNLVRGNKTEPSSASSTASGNSRRGSLLDLVSGEGSRLGRLGSLIGTTNESANDKNPAKIRVLITNARDSEIGRIAVQLLRAETLFPAPVRPWLCVTCTPAEVEIIENDWNVDEIIVIPHLPSASECNISKVFRARRWDPVDIVLDCAGEEVFRQAHAAGVVKDYGAVLTVVDSKVAMQSPLVPENDELGERKRGIRSRFVPVNPDGPAIERIAELIEENLVRGKEARVVDLARSADLLAAGAAGTAGGLRGDMVVVKVQ
jgi:NADPH:quinone reductase-like Zn-dependent oxidoreductase